MRTLTIWSVLTAIALLRLFGASDAEELWVVQDGKLIKEGLDWSNVGTANEAFAKQWVHCAGETADGLYVVPRQVGDRQNHARFIAAKSALGDCAFRVVFCCPDGRGTAMPIVQIRDRGRLLFARDGSQIWMSLRKQSLPLETFAAPCEKNPYDGNLHSMGVERVGDKISFYYDDKQINEQPIDPDTNLHVWFDALQVPLKIKSMRLTAEMLSDKLTTRFKSAAAIEEIFQGSEAREKPEYGKACRYRIPALAISTGGTILAFAEARRVSGADIGNIDAVVRRSEDGGKTWGPEIVIWDDGERSVNNPSAVVDPKTGWIWLFMGRWDGMTPSQHVAYSDDDGKTWSKPQDMTRILRDQIKDGRSLVIPGPGAGIALTRSKYAGRLIIPMNHGAAWGPSVVYSDDHGKTWRPGGALHANIGESKCAELGDGSVLIVGNPGPPETRRRLTVLGEGGTQNSTEMWHAEDLRHVGCQGAVQRHSWPKDGGPGLILYSGPDSTVGRAHGALRGSYDEGKTWPWNLEYYQGPSGYSDVAVLADGRVAVLFEKDGKSNLGFTILPAPSPTLPSAAADKPADKSDAATAETPPLVIDKATGHYRDLSYEALNDEGLSWEEETRLFGGETATYGPLTDDRRKAKQKELDELLAEIDMELINKCEADVRAWLDQRAARVLKHEDWRQDWSFYHRGSMWHLAFGAATFFRAYEIWGDRKYLEAGLRRADVFLRDQDPRGNWRKNMANDGRYCRIQDKFQDAPFFIMLYAYKVSGDKKYFESARRCADLLLTLQRPDSGGWGDQWLFDGAPLVNSGVIHGTSHNDSATIAPLTMMVMMYHMTKEKKYVANLHKLGPHIARTNLGEGDIVGWAEAYSDGGNPQRVRQYEIEICYPSSLTRSIGFLLTWLYLIDGNEAHMDLMKKAYATLEKIRQHDLKAENWKCWRAVKDAHRETNGPGQWYHPGFPHAFLPDGSNWGRILGFAMYPYYPVTPEMRKQWGRFIHSNTNGDLYQWAEGVSAGRNPPQTLGSSGAGNSLVQVRRALLEHKRGGREALLQYYTGPVKYTPDQYLQARLDAANRALDERNVRLAAMHDRGIHSLPDCASLVKPKGRWYGPKESKWGHAYEDKIMHEQYPGSTAWYQWQLVYDTLLARGKIDADAAARGGRGMEAWMSMMSHLDSWDVLGPYDMQVFEVENHFDVPIEGDTCK